MHFERSPLFALLGTLASPPWANPLATVRRRPRAGEPEDPQVTARRAARESLLQTAADARAFLTGDTRLAGADSVPAGDERSGSLLAARALRWLPMDSDNWRHRYVRHLREGDDLETIGATRAALWSLGLVGVDELGTAARAILHRAAAVPCRGPAGEVPEGVLVCRSGDASWADPAVIAEAMVPVLLAIRSGQLHFEDLVEVEGCLDGAARVRPSVVADLVRRNLHYLSAHLLSEYFEEGTPTCPSPDLLLALVSELWRTTTPLSATLRRPLQMILIDRLQSEEPTDALGRAARLVAAENLHLPKLDLVSERLGLAALQDSDGGFTASPVQRAAPGAPAIGSRAFTTTLVLRALAGQPRCRMARS